MAAPRPIAPGLFASTASGPRLIAGRCDDCHRLHFPAGAWCPYCAGAACRETHVGPEATLFLATSIRTAPPGYRGPVPYGFGIVELPEGLRVITRLGGSEPERLPAGVAMRLAIAPLHEDEDGRAVLSYLFEPAS